MIAILDSLNYSLTDVLTTAVLCQYDINVASALPYNLLKHVIVNLLFFFFNFIIRSTSPSDRAKSMFDDVFALF